MYKLIHINKHLIDIFFGEEGWEPWSRVEKRHNRLHVVAGQKHIPAEIWNKVKEQM